MIDCAYFFNPLWIRKYIIEIMVLLAFILRVILLSELIYCSPSRRGIAEFDVFQSELLFRASGKFGHIVIQLQRQHASEITRYQQNMQADG